MFRFLITVFLTTLFPGIAFAIPSPDIVINLFGSLAQLAGLLSVIFGGFAYSLKSKKKRTSPWPFRISLGLLFCTLLAFGLYVSHRTDLDNKRLRRNLTRTSVEEGKTVGDTSLKTLSFSGQQAHPRGITTEELGGLLESGALLNLIDVRETEETEAGGISGSWRRRYPDLLKNRRGLIAENRKTVLLCYSGNRSSELSDRFYKDGIETHFLVGGYEKWISEGLPLGTGQKDSKELRALPPFPNDHVLLHTEEVEKMANTGNPLFVDVRYPMDFQRGHLPGAVNIPLRKMTEDEVREALKELPKGRPVISPCYDKRSCFYSLILGLKLSRIGHDFRGRYTVPHEFAPRPKVREHVKEWQRRRDGTTFFGIIGKPIKWIMIRIHNEIKTGVGSIILTVIILRILFLVFTVKADKDKLKERKRAPQVAILKKKLGKEPVRLQRALASIAKEDELTPLFNTIGNVLQLIVFIVMFTVVMEFSIAFDEPFLWISGISGIDPYYILPSLVAVSIFLHLFFMGDRPSKKMLCLYILGGAALFFLTFGISAGLNIYLVSNLAILIIHGRVVRFLFNLREKGEKAGEPAPPKEYSYSGITPLKYLYMESGGGNKALKLAELIRGGFPVPNGFSLSEELIFRKELTSGTMCKIKKAWNSLGAQKVAVRSSGVNEDGSDMSYAGIFESKLNVTWDSFNEALREVADSLMSSRARAYSGQEETGGVVVQKMVDSEYSGVMFTEHPENSGSSLVEVVKGLGESLVSGQATPYTYQFGRFTGQPMFTQKPVIDLKPLLKLGRRVERHYRKPQDIEWAYSRGRFYIVQTRDITTGARFRKDHKGLLERERLRHLNRFKDSTPEEVILTQDDLTSLLPYPSRLSLSLMNRIWAPGGTVDLACAGLGFPYDVEEDAMPYVVTCFGRLYVNAKEKEKRMGKGPGMLASFRLARAAEGIELHFRKEFLPSLLKKVNLYEALDFKKFSLGGLVELFREWERDFVTKTYLEAEIINVAAESYMRAAIKELEKKGENPREHLGQMPETIVSKAMSLLPLIRKGEREAKDFLDIFGFRAPLDFELSSPRYNESPQLLDDMVARSGDAFEKGEQVVAPLKSEVLRLVVKRARNFQALKEEAKHYCLREYAMLRPLLLELGNRLGICDRIFFLEVEEILRLADPSFANEAINVVELRRPREFKEERVNAPMEFTPGGLERYGLDLEDAPAPPKGALMLKGIRISGTGVGVGRVRVLTDSRDLDIFEKGEILVARFTDPSWTPLFSLAAGVITEVGGWLSHAAIIARELNLVGVVGVANATTVLRTGDFVAIHEDGAVEIEPKTRKRVEMRHYFERNLMVVWDGIPVEVTMLNISRSGALVEVDNNESAIIDLQTTGSVQLIPRGEQRDVTATQVSDNRFILHFTKLLDPHVIPTMEKR